MEIHRKPIRLILTITALTLLLSILLACDTEATPVPEDTPVAEPAAVSAPAPPAASVIEPSAQPQATAASEMAAPDLATNAQVPVQARAEAQAPAPVATEEPAPTEEPTPTLAPTPEPTATPTLAPKATPAPTATSAPETTPTLPPTATSAPETTPTLPRTATPAPETTPTTAPTPMPVPMVQTDQAGAQAEACRLSGIVHGSVSIASTNSVAGQVSRHAVRFQLCPAIESQANALGSKPPDKIGLLWESTRKWPSDGFVLDQPGAAGITLSESGTARVWPATVDFSEAIDPKLNRDYCSLSWAHYDFTDFQGVTVEFPPAVVNDSSLYRADFPLNLQFWVPESAGMSNPRSIGEYRWRIVLFRDVPNARRTSFTSITSSKVTAYTPRELQLFPHLDNASTMVTLVGHGFKPLEPVQSVHIGTIDVTPDYKTSTDGRGDFELEIQVPGLDVGLTTVQVQVDGKTPSAEFTVTYSGHIGVPLHKAEESFGKLGDNFVRAFHYNADTCRWTFYDPESWEENDLRYLITGLTYWVLVKEPDEVILNNSTRNLTCTPEGNCWNQIEW